MAMEEVHIWLGDFPSDDALHDYLEEAYDEDDDDAPINRFAAEQEVSFYDVDFLESGFDESGDLKSLIEGHSYSETYLDDLTAAAESEGIEHANTFIMVDAGEIEEPQSVSGDDYQLTYLGIFAAKS